MNSTETKAAHTPGPWYVERKYEGSCTVAILRDWIKSHGVALAVHGPTGWIHAADAGAPMIDANARLIAAAPDLLEALKTTAGNLRSLGPAGVIPRYPVWLEVVDAAIAKAEGRQE